MDDEPKNEPEQPRPERKLIGLFDLRTNSIEHVVEAAVRAMEDAGL